MNQLFDASGQLVVLLPLLPGWNWRGEGQRPRERACALSDDGISSIISCKIVVDMNIIGIYYHE